MRKSAVVCPRPDGFEWSARHFVCRAIHPFANLAVLHDGTYRTVIVACDGRQLGQLCPYVVDSKAFTMGQAGQALCAWFPRETASFFFFSFFQDFVSPTRGTCSRSQRTNGRSVLSWCRDCQVEIVFPVASEAMTATGEGGAGGMEVVPGVSGKCSHTENTVLMRYGIAHCALRPGPRNSIRWLFVLAVGKDWLPFYSRLELNNRRHSQVAEDFAVFFLVFDGRVRH